MPRTMPTPHPDEFTGRRAIVTGGSRGIGAAIVQRLLDGGAAVVAAARTATDETPEAATFVRGDVSTLAGAQALAAAAIDVLGGVDIVVNNAGAARPYPGGIASIPDEEWLDALGLNYLAAVRVTTALLPAMREAGEGSVIVNVSSAAALLPAPPIAHYGAAKAALNAYGKALAAELAPVGIRVATVVPGNVHTPSANDFRRAIADGIGIPADAMTAGIPLGRVGDPADIAEAVAYLASDRAQWITGASLIVDGGEVPAI